MNWFVIKPTIDDCRNISSVEKAQATLFMPLSWDEVKPGLPMTQFAIRNAIARLRETGGLISSGVGPGH